jgi:signal transduction histidine kinase
MRTTSPLRRLQFEAAERRVLEQLTMSVPMRSRRRHAAVLGVATILFALTFAARLVIADPAALLANFYVVPIALLAVEFGTRAGLLAAAVSLGLVLAWSAIDTVHVSALGYSSRIAALIITGGVVGWSSQRLRADIAARQLAQQHLAMYADELERSNDNLGRTVDRLEAFEAIARAVGGEIDVDHVLRLILERGREILTGGELVAYLPEANELVAVDEARLPEGLRPRLAVDGSSVGEVFISGRSRRLTAANGLHELQPAASEDAVSILVPLVFRGETLGVLCVIETAGTDRLTAENEQLLMSIAASAATAVATARSVAAVRLRTSLEAAEEARARWARELHDETLQGLTGVRMVLAAGLAQDQLGALRRAAEAADEHLGEEVRKLRELIAELRPAALDDLGLAPAIESLTQRQAGQGGFIAELNLDLDLDSQVRMSPETESVVYRIVQEALSNVVKHAEARRVTLSVRRLSDRVELAVEDDGRGFDTGRVYEGFGLVGMRERALLVGGQLQVTSPAGGTTRVSAVLPADQTGSRGAGPRTAGHAVETGGPSASDAVGIDEGSGLPATEAPSMPERPPAIDHLNWVALSRGENNPGREPRRTNSTGEGAAFAISDRVGPSPSRRQRSDSPMTSRPALDAAETMPSRPPETTSG